MPFHVTEYHRKQKIHRKFGIFVKKNFSTTTLVRIENVLHLRIALDWTHFSHESVSVSSSKKNIELYENFNGISMRASDEMNRFSFLLNGNFLFLSVATIKLRAYLK